MAKQANFSELITKRLEKADINFSNKFADITEFIPTGNYLLNAQLSGTLFGGLANTRMTVLAGDSGAGKTFLALNMCREAQKKGYFIVYCDTETAVSKDDMESFGIDTDPEKCLYVGVTSIEDFGMLCNNIIQVAKEKKEKGEEPKIVFILDSLGMLNSKKELDDLNKGKNASDMGTRAKELRKLFRNITFDFSNNGICFLPLNHVYEGGMYEGKKMGGGGGAIFSASTILFLSKGHLKDGADEKTKTGIIVRSKTQKNRLAKPIDIEFHISHIQGMNPYVGLQDYISWDNCGVVRGTLLTAKEFSKDKSLKDKLHYETEIQGEKYFVVPSDKARNIVVKDGDISIKEISFKKMFSGDVFTENVLKELDIKVIKPKFQYDKIKDLLAGELNEIFGDGEEAEEEIEN